jgi:hypothetical protein
MSAALTTIASVTANDVTAADAFGGFVVLMVAILSFLSISGLALSMTLGASKSPSTMAITAVAGLISVIIAVGLFMTVSVHHSPKIDGCPAEMWDRLGGIFAFTMGIVGFLTIGGMLVTAAIGAFTSGKSPVTSWPMEQEQSFTGYDRRNAVSQSRAWAFGVGAAVFVFVSVIGISKAIKPDDKDLSKEMNMSNLTKKSKQDGPETPKAQTPKTEAPKAETPKAETPKAETPKE